MIQQSKVVTISGSIPNGASKTIYSKLVALCKQSNKPVLVDTSGQLLKDILSSKPTMIKPNKEELQAIIEEPLITQEDFIRVGERLNQDGIKIVAISLGKEGVLVVCDQGVYQEIGRAYV